MKSIHIQSLPLHRPIILQKHHSLREAAQAMRANQVGSVLVSDGHGLIQGIVTDRDLAMALAIENQTPSSTLESNTKNRLVYVSETATLEDVVRTMQEFAIRRVPVLHLRSNGRHRCIGVISLDDLVKEGLIDIAQEKKILRAQLKSSRRQIGRGRMRSIFHSQGHREHTYHAFIKTIENHTGLNRTNAQTLTQDVLTFLLKRMTAASGKKLLSQLPYEIQMTLLPYISSADRSMTGHLLLAHIEKRFRMKEHDARLLLSDFWRGLGEILSSGELRHVRSELPRETANLFDQFSH